MSSESLSYCFRILRQLFCFIQHEQQTDKDHLSDLSIVVGVLCLLDDDTNTNIQTWRTKLSAEVRVSFHKLTSSELDDFQAPSDWEYVQAVILLHSAERSGRLSLTDVKEARYDKLLETLKENYGKLTISR